MKALISVGGWVVAVLMIAAALADNARGNQRLADMKAKLDSANAVRVVDSVEVVRTVTKTRTLRDTIDITDTVQVREYLYQTDTLRIACMACIASASQVSVAAESVYVAAKRPPRLSTYGEISRDIAINHWRVAAGAELRVAGPWSLFGRAEAIGTGYAETSSNRLWVGGKVAWTP